MITNNLRDKGKDIDKYKEYLAYGDSPKNPLKNPKNIFDSLNSKDTKWLKLTRAYLINRKALLAK